MLISTDPLPLDETEALGQDLLSVHEAVAAPALSEIFAPKVDDRPIVDRVSIEYGGEPIINGQLFVSHNVRQAYADGSLSYKLIDGALPNLLSIARSFLYDWLDRYSALVIDAVDGGNGIIGAFSDNALTFVGVIGQGAFGFYLVTHAESKLFMIERAFFENESIGVEVSL